MSAEQQPIEPEQGQVLGWVVTDPDGNVVDSGPLTHAQAAFFTGEASTEGEQ
jgi:hypothetical protein